MSPMRNVLCFTFTALILVTSASAYAGVTIHYEGRAADSAAVEQILIAASDEAKSNGWQSRDASSADVSAKRVIDEKDVSYRGPIRGIVIQPQPDCEPIYVQFDSHMFMQDFVKTQFAGSEVHIQVVRLLKKIQPLLINLRVDDEGEYWESGNKTKLEANITTVNALMVEMKRSKPGLKGPVTLPSGRIVDLMR